MNQTQALELLASAIRHQTEELSRLRTATDDNTQSVRQLTEVIDRERRERLALERRVSAVEADSRKFKAALRLDEEVTPDPFRRFESEPPPPR